jgi:branched-chain amino acid transport system substrate-binding protein
LSKGVFAIENFSAFTFGSYRITRQAGVPVTGGAFDGPEWGQRPNTNMFAYLGGTNGRTSENLVTANFFKWVGATNLGGLAYGISPSSTQSIVDLKTALGTDGLKMGYENLSVPFGGVDVTSYVLAIKSGGVDGVVCSCVQSTDLALFTGLKQGGVKVKAELSLSSADSSLFADPTAAAAAQGAYYASSVPPLDLNNAASNTFVTNVKAADSKYKGGYPSFGVTNAYLAAVLTVKGLQVAGQNPTRESFIKNFTAVTNWNADGLLASSVSFNHFGSSEPTTCEWFVQVQGSVVKSVDKGQSICGKSF